MSGEPRDPPSGITDLNPMVSVLVAAWNEADHIGACLAALESNTWPRLQVLVSAGGPDGTFDIARRYASDRIAVFPQEPRVGKQAALRSLLGSATGEIVFLTDGDTIVPDATLRSVLEPIVSGNAQVVTGNYRPYPGSTSVPLVFYQWSIDRVVERRRGSDSEGITGANAAVSRTALDHAGGFDRDVKTGTDYFLARRLRSCGYPIRYVDAGVETEYAETARQFLKRRSRWLRNTFMHGFRLDDRAEVRNSLLTMGMGIAAVGGPAVAVFNKWIAGVMWGALIGLLLKRRLHYASELASEQGLALPQSYILYLPYLTLLDQLASVLAAADLLSEQRRTRW